MCIRDRTHQYPEWKRHEPALRSKLASRVPMNYRDFLRDPEGDADPCFELGKKDRAAIASGIDEISAFERRWR
jgi:hypothetical protein